MITIYSKEDVGDYKNILTDYANGFVWSFPLKEIDYLLKEHNGESFVLIGNRLYEYILYKEEIK